jgi:hypothetical protein
VVRKLSVTTEKRRQTATKNIEIYATVPCARKRSRRVGRRIRAVAVAPVGLSMPALMRTAWARRDSAHGAPIAR